MGIKIIGIGRCLPEKVMSNQDLERILDTSDEWIRTRSGIESRRIAAPHETVPSMGAEAASGALKMAGIAPDLIDCIVLGTSSPAQLFPAGACRLQEILHCKRAFAFDVQAVCSSLLFALQTARGLLSVMQGRRYALVVGAEKMSSVLDWTDRETCVLFGDGAAAMVLERTDDMEDSFLAVSLHSDGAYADHLQIPAGGSTLPASVETLQQHLHFLKMDGKLIYRLAVSLMSEACLEVLDSAGMSLEEVRWIVPHQANIRIIRAIGEKLNVPQDRVYVNLQQYGNTCAATIGIALCEMYEKGLLKTGDPVLLVTAGGGFTWGAVLLRWSC